MNSTAIRLRNTVDVNDEELRAAAKDAARDQASQASRVHVCRVLGETLPYIGELLWVGGAIVGPDRAEGTSPFDFGSDAMVGLALAVQIGGQLMAGAVALLEAGNHYAAAALTRQIVEVEYLTWAFAEDEAEAKSWMRASPAERRRFWQPRHIRERSAGRFRAAGYGGHCERGGHPTPQAAPLLPNHSAPHEPQLDWLDLASHGVSVWHYTLAAADRLRQLGIAHADRWRSSA
jgi:hypothetical protein